MLRRHRDDARLIARALLGQTFDVLARGKADDLEPVRMRVHHRQRALPDRAGGAEDSDPLHDTWTRAGAGAAASDMIEHDVVNGCGEQQRIDAVEHTTMAGNERRTV